MSAAFLSVACAPLSPSLLGHLIYLLRLSPVVTRCQPYAPAYCAFTPGRQCAKCAVDPAFSTSQGLQQVGAVIIPIPQTRTLRLSRRITARASSAGTWQSRDGSGDSLTPSSTYGLSHRAKLPHIWHPGCSKLASCLSAICSSHIFPLSFIHTLRSHLPLFTCHISHLLTAEAGTEPWGPKPSFVCEDGVLPSGSHMCTLSPYISALCTSRMFALQFGGWAAQRHSM